MSLLQALPSARYQAAMWTVTDMPVIYGGLPTGTKALVLSGGAWVESCSSGDTVCGSDRSGHTAVDVRTYCQ